MSPTLYEAIGSAGAVARLVDELYDRLVEDPLVAHHFEPARLPSLKTAQCRWFEAALSGQFELPTDLAAAHAELDITDAHVAALLGHLDDALAEIGVRPRLRASVAGVVGRLWHARNF